MFFKMDSLGEKTLSKIAEYALNKQLKAEDWKVEVKTDPQKLSQGILESISINGKGLKTSENIRMDGMKITLNTIAVSPLKALMGNIQLTQPSHGSACITLTEKDLESAFNPETIKAQWQEYPIYLDGQLVNLDLKEVNCYIHSDGSLVIKSTVYVQQTQETHKVSITTTPIICATKEGLILADIHCSEGEELSAIMLKPLILQAQKIFNLTNLQMKGVSLLVENVAVEEGQLIIQASADITSFPS